MIKRGGGQIGQVGLMGWGGEKLEYRISNIEHRILNGEAEIGGVLRGGWFNRFLDKLGMTRTGDGNLARGVGFSTLDGG